MLGDSRFFDLLAGRYSPENKSLQELTGEKIGSAPTPMIQRVKKAWTTSMPDLLSEQVRLLVSQRMGLRHLAEPIALFVRVEPVAFVSFYPGDLSIAALRAFREILLYSPVAAREMAAVDFRELIRGVDEIEPELGQQTRRLVQEALALSLGHS